MSMAATATDAVATAIRGVGTTAAGELAELWLSTADRGAQESAAARDRASLDLLAAVLGVPAGFFLDDQTTAAIHRDLAEEAGAGIVYIGPCRGARMGADRLWAIRTRLRSELQARTRGTGSDHA